MAFVIRMAEKKDLNALYTLSKFETLGSLPADKKIIAQIIDNNVKSIFSKSKKKIDKCYLFILEDLKKKKLIGTGVIQAQKTHNLRANYTFQIIKEKKYSHSLDISVDHVKLKLMADYEPLTELGGLLINKTYRGFPNQLGKLLSYSRLFYISQFSNLFSSRLYSEIIPKTTDFWKLFSSKFIPLDFYQADLFSKENQEFFSSLLPKEDIYLSLLSKKIQKSIGQVTVSGKKSMYLLKKAGFVFLNTVDPFDGGPCLYGQINSLPFYNKCLKTKIYNLKQASKSKDIINNTDKYFLISSGNKKNFRCVLICPEKISFLKEKIQIYCNLSVLDSLKVKSGQDVTCYMLNKS